VRWLTRIGRDRPGNPRKGGVGPDGFEQRRADAGHPIQALQRPERAVLFAVGNDSGSQPRPDPRETLDLLGTGGVEVNSVSLP